MKRGGGTVNEVDVRAAVARLNASVVWHGPKPLKSRDVDYEVAPAAKAMAEEIDRQILAKLRSR